jgi:tape measure domain-containing protein
MKLYEYIWRFKDQASDKIDKISRASRGATNNVDKLNDEMREGSRQSKLFGQGLGYLKRAVAGLAIGAVLFTGAKAASKLGMEMEQTRITFETMLQSAEKAKSMLFGLDQFSNATPFTNNAVRNNAQLLLNFGIASEKVIPSLKMLGDVSAGNKEKFDALSLAYSQVQSTGKLMGQDLLQMINAGFNPLNELSKQTGKSMAVLKDEMSKGAISADMVTKAFKGATSQGGMFFNMMEKQSKTTAGKISTLTGKSEMLLMKVGESFNRFYSPAIDGLIDTTDVLLERLKSTNELYDDQRNRVIDLEKSAVPLINRYNELTEKTKLNADEQDELKSVTQQLAEIVPTAATAFDKYGRAIGLSKEKLDQFVTSNKDALALLNKDAIAEKEEQIRKLEEDSKQLQDLLNQGYNIESLPMFGSGTMAKTVKVPFTDQEMREMASKLNGMTGEGGLIEMLENEVKNLRGETDVDRMLTGNKPSDSGLIPDSMQDDELKKGIDSINGGGKKSVNVTVNLGSLIQEQRIEMNNLQEGLEDIEKQVTEALLRVINSANYSAAQ